MPIDPQDIAAIIDALNKTAGVPISVRGTVLDEHPLGEAFAARPPITVRFPPCADLLLSLCKPSAREDQIDDLFSEYFSFGRSAPSLLFAAAQPQLDRQLWECAGSRWPPDACFREPCVRLEGDRNNGKDIRTLGVGDIFFVYYLGERLGIFRLLGMILDDYALKGTLPISNGKILAGLEDDLVALVLEEMVLQTQRGESSQVRQRGSLYSRVLGYKVPPPANVANSSQVNSAFHDLFNQLILEIELFLADKRVAVAIRGAAAPAPPASASTLISIRDTIRLLQDSFQQFYYGRNYTIALHGIVWTIAGLSLVRALRGTLGIPVTFTRPEDYIPAALDRFLGQSDTAGKTNRYIVHRDTALNARDILMDVEVFDLNAPGVDQIDGPLDRWIHTIERKVEGFRTAYKLLTGVDLGTTRNPATEQRA